MQGKSGCRMRLPPPTRGWTPHHGGGDACQHGSPAHAGMDPLALILALATPGLPRPRGDGPCCANASKKPPKAPPPTRGWTLPRALALKADAGSPAHAGMDPWRTDAPSGGLRLPRPRGDGPARGQVPDRVVAAPPPTRGWTLMRQGADQLLIGSPAHAGMDPSSVRPGPSASWLPRPRGDGPVFVNDPSSQAAAPPPTRGWTRDVAREQFRRDGSPAHAGMDPSRQRAAQYEAWLPRPRGDGPASKAAPQARDPAPPPTRGWTRGALARPGRHAGSPRPRGDGPG